MSAIANARRSDAWLVSFVHRLGSRILILGWVCLMAGWQPVRAGHPGSLDASFHPALTNGSGGVWAVRLQPDQKMVVASGQGIVRLLPDGSADPDFHAYAFASYTPSCLALQADGRIVFGGAWPVGTGSVGRLNSDGTVDSTFTVGTGANGMVFSVVVLPNQQLMVAGDFTTFAGVPRQGLVRLASDGTLDTTFTLAPGGIRSLAVAADGAVLAAGVWVRGQGGPDRGLLRILSNGTVDPAFALQSTGDNAWLDVVMTQRDGRILTGGYGIGVAGVYRPIARFGAEGNADLAFPRGEAMTDGPDVRAIAEQADGKIVVGGNFTGLQGVRRPWLMRLNPDGSVDDQFVADAMNGAVLALAIQADGKILAGGLFDSVSGQSNPGLVRLNPSGESFGGQFEFSTGQVEVAESASQVTLTVNRLFSTEGTATVRAATVDYSAEAGVQYVATNVTLTFGPGETSRPLTVQLIDDAIYRGFEAFEVQLSNPSANTVLGTTNRISVLLRDDDTNVEFSAPAYSIREHVANQLAEVRVVRRGGAFGSSTVEYASADLTAKAGVDYEAVAGTLEFAGFEAEKILSIPVHPNEGQQGHRTFQLRLSNPSGGLVTTLGSNTVAVVTLLDDNGPGGVDTSFQPGFGADGGVTRVGIGLDGATLLHGGFLHVNQSNCPAFARLRADGSVEADFPPTRPWFIPQGDDALAVEADGSVLLASRELYRIRPTGVVERLFPQFPTQGELFGRVIVQPDQRLLWIGSYSVPGEGMRQQFLRLLPDGTPDPEFTAATTPEDTVSDALLQPDGRILLSGSFKNFTGTPRARLLRLEPDGAVDVSFPVGSGPNDLVQAVGLQPDGRIVIAGGFTRVDGQPRVHFARLEPDGTLDPSFEVPLWAADSVLPPGDGFSRVRIGGDGKVVVAGSFSFIWPAGSLEFSDRHSGLVRLHPDGSPDVEFSPANEGSGFAASFRDLCFQADGKIVVGGWFDFINGYPRRNFARLNNDLDAGAGQFALVATDFAVSESAGTVSLAVRRSGGSRGAVVVGYGARGAAKAGRDFELPGAWVRFEDGDTQDKLIAVRIVDNQLGEENRAFQLSLGNVVGSGVLAHPAVATVTILDDDVSLAFVRSQQSVLEGDGSVRLEVRRTGSSLPAVSVQYATRELSARVGEDFVATTGTLNFPADTVSQFIEVPLLPNSWGEGDRGFEVVLSAPAGGATLGTVPVQRVVIVDDDRPGSLDSQFNRGANPSPGTLRLRLTTMALQPDGQLLAGGEFTLNMSTLAGMTRLKADGSLDTGFGTDGITPLPVSPQAVAAQSNGRILVAGNSMMSTGSLLRLLPSGAVDGTFPMLDLGAITALHVLPDDRILVAGSIQRDGLTLGLIRLSAAGVVDASFARTDLEFAPGFAGGNVRCLARAVSGDLYVGGEFSRIGGSPRTGFAKLDSAGVVAPAFGPLLGLPELSPDRPGVGAMLLRSDGKLVISGRFTTVNGTPRAGLARLLPDGSLDSSFDAELALAPGAPPLTPSPVGYAVSLIEDVGGRLLAVGRFTRANGEIRHGVARLLDDGSLDRFYDPAAGVSEWTDPAGTGGNTITAALREASGQLLVGGDFEEFNGQPRIALARLNGGLLLSVVALELTGPDAVRLLVDIPTPADYVLQTSPDLIHWSDRQTNQFGAGRHEVNDSGTPGEPGQGFYRLKPR
jgi:uncharacterized delta-60 repeat protein